MIWTIVGIVYVLGVFAAPVVLGMMEGHEREVEGPDVAAFILWPLAAFVLFTCAIGWLLLWLFNKMHAIGARTRPSKGD